MPARSLCSDIQEGGCLSLHRTACEFTELCLVHRYQAKTRMSSNFKNAISCRDDTQIGQQEGGCSDSISILLSAHRRFMYEGVWVWFVIASL